MNDKEAQGVSCLLGGLLGVILLPFRALLTGFTVSTLWTWFMVPIFNVRPLSILAAIGLTLIVSLFTAKFKATPKDEEIDALKDVVQGAVFTVFVCAFTLGEGWIVMKLMNG